MKGFYQPPVCKCFGGFCMKQYGCPNKAAKKDKPKKEPKRRALKPTEAYVVDGKKITTNKLDIRVWRPETENENG